MDPWQQAAANIGADFAAFMNLAQSVTITQIDPDTDTNTTPAGATLGIAIDIPALKRVRKRQPFEVGGGELGTDTVRFVFQASALTWIPKARDQITEANGITWDVAKVELLAFNQLVACDVTIKR